VQHHHAHLASCAAEHGIRGPVIGVAYDGLGLGDDGTFWGGEILVADLRTYRRVARFALAPLPGGSLAVRKPYRMALGYLFGAEDGDLGDNEGHMTVPTSAQLTALGAPFLARLDPREVAVVRQQIGRRLNAPLASSAGRLFDAVASLLDIRDVAEYEAQAAVELEQIAAAAAPGQAAAGPAESLPYRIVRRDGLLVYDPRPTLAALLAARGGADGTDAVLRSRLAARFQETMVTVTRELCAEVRRASGLGTVCLSGGVFQNQWLAETLLARLRGDGFEAFINCQVPVNDGGISYGQAAVAAAQLAG
jgi:hydrogenase maturation protein HypF